MINVNIGIGQVRIKNKGDYGQTRYNFHKGIIERQRERKEQERNKKRIK